MTRTPPRLAPCLLIATLAVAACGEEPAQPTCTEPACLTGCGDGIVDLAAGERCDAPNTNMWLHFSLLSESHCIRGRRS